MINRKDFNEQMLTRAKICSRTKQDFIRHFYFHVEACAGDGNIFKENDKESPVDQLYNQFSVEDITTMVNRFTSYYLENKHTIKRNNALKTTS